MYNYVKLENNIVIGYQGSPTEIFSGNLILVTGSFPELGSVYIDGNYTTGVTSSFDRSQIISVRAFEQRFTTAERHAMRNSPDIDVEDIYISALRSTYVDLNDPLITQGLQYILYSLLTVPNIRDSSVMTVVDDSLRLVELLVKGTDSEKFNGVL